MDGIPTKINGYNGYNEGEKLVGITGTVKLPELEAVSETISGPGILGEIDDPAVGHFGSQEMEIPFLTICGDMFRLFDPTKGVNLTLRGSEQVTTPEGGISYVGQRIVVRGRNKGVSLGELTQGKPQNPTVKVEVTYLLIERGGTVLLELDKFNSVFKVNGVDQLAAARELC